MAQNGAANFLYLNRDNRWPDFQRDGNFQWVGLELRPDGAIQLCTLPRLEGELPKEMASFAMPSGPAGIVVDLDGTIYLSDSIGHRLIKIDGCDQKMVPMPCIGGKYGKPTQLNTPRGLFIPFHRRSLFVVDSANHRVQVFDLASLQLVDIWGLIDSTGESQASADPGCFDMPLALAGDSEGNIYVVDYGNQRVQKFNAFGEVIPAFWDAMRATNILDQPSDIAVYLQDGETLLYIIDESKRAVFIFDAEGHPVLWDGFGTGKLQKPMGIAVAEDAVYVGDNAHRRVLKFKNGGDYSWMGEAVGYQGPIAALALDNKGHLLVHSGSDLPPVLLSLTKGYQTEGFLWSRAIKSVNGKVIWHRFRAEVNGLRSNSHIQFFLYTSDDESDHPSKPSNNSPFADPRWREISLDVTDLFIGSDPACCLWIGARFLGDGTSTPIVTQMRVEFDHETYLNHLPAIYSANAQSHDFLIRFLSLFESFFGEVESKINNLPVLFDPDAVPDEFLSWLAGWLSLQIDEEWDEETKRQAVAGAFETYAKRGTVEGLQESLRLFAGVHAIIKEPIQNAAWWSLPAPKENTDKIQGSTRESWQATDNSVLGFTTMLASAQAQGAVIGTSAILDQSHLITQDDFGAPLFEDVAHQFNVQVYRGELKCAETLPKVHAVIEREKPAHTTYRLCIIEPRMRIGFQARVGIDAIVSGPQSVISLDSEMSLGESSALGGQPGGRLGAQSQIGVTTRVG